MLNAPLLRIASLFRLRADYYFHMDVALTVVNKCLRDRELHTAAGEAPAAMLVSYLRGSDQRIS